MLNDITGSNLDGQRMAITIQGPILLGVGLNLLLYGVNCCQVYRYLAGHAAKGNAGIWSSCFVTSLLLLDTLCIIFNGWYIYRTLITHFGDAEYLLQSDWTLNIELFFAGIVGLLTQGFFGHRVRKVTGSSLSAFVVWTLSVIQFVATVITGAIAFKKPQFLEFLNDARVKALVIVWLIASVACDAIITSALVLYLRRQKIGFVDSDRLIDRIVRLTVQTGLISTIVVSLDLILYLFYHKQALHLMVNLVIINVYINSTLCSLNARHILQVEASGEGMAVELRSGCEKRFSRVQQLHNGVAIPPQVFVSSESHAISDAPPLSTAPRSRAISEASTSKGTKAESRRSRSTLDIPFAISYGISDSRQTVAQYDPHRPQFPAPSTPEGVCDLEFPRPISCTDSFTTSDTLSWDYGKHWGV
ncbi:hypothetical protein PENSPDRAFT_733589 [Peniophora sp. CONT]|nr:hypothetical protein PENSPDRAFT_733589 [Peniophora sp. CONT]